MTQPNAARRAVTAVLAALRVPDARAAATAPVPCSSIDRLATAMAGCGDRELARALLRTHTGTCPTVGHTVALPGQNPASVQAANELVRALMSPPLHRPVGQAWTCDQADVAAVAIHTIDGRASCARDVLIAHAGICTGLHAAVTTMEDARLAIISAFDRGCGS